MLEALEHQAQVVNNKILTPVFSSNVAPLELIKQCLEEAVTMGQLSEIDIQLTAEAILAYRQGVMMFAKVRNEPEVLKSLSKGAQELAITRSE